MIGRMDISRCGPCCLSYECLISEGDLDGIEEAGEWTRDTSEGSFSADDHTTADDNAIWLDPTLPIPSGVPWQVSVRPEIKITLTGGSRWGSYEIRLYGGWVDDENHVYLRYQEHRPSSGTSYLNLALVIVIAGVEEVIAEHTFNSTTCYNEAVAGDLNGSWGFGNFQLSNFHSPTGDLYLCWDGTTLLGQSPFYGEVTDAPPIQAPLRIAAYKLADGTLLSDILPARGLAGLGTGTLSTEIIKVIFQLFEYRLSNTTGTDGPCGDCEEHCCNGRVPGELIIEISGATGDHADFNGTYFLPHRLELSSAFTGTHNCAGDGRCAWQTTATGSVSGLDMSVTGRIKSFVVGSLLIALVRFNTSAPFTTTVNLSATIDQPCDQYTDWTNLSGGPGGSTCRFKMAA